MAIQIGQTVRVKTGQQDEETGTSISGWSGRVIAINLEDDMLEVEWDSRTLLLLPDAYIRHSIDGDYDYLRYYIDITSVEPIKPRDAASDVKAAQLALEVHYQDYERYGRRPLPFSEGEEDADAFFVSEAAAKSKKELLDALNTIEGSGSFAVSGVRQFIHPGLTVEGVGEIALPLSPGQAQDLIRHAHRAPFGKGSQTITDTSVRSAWEVDADRLSFLNEDWNAVILAILDTVKEGLGIENQPVKASLYKLLLYEAGDFFLPHKDSEKEKGMFASLVVGLPSVHTGGELIIRFEGQAQTVDFAPAASSYKIPFAAFYADCEHEVKPATSGYRLCLVYNLVQTGGGQKISSPQFSRQAKQMAGLLRSLEADFEGRPQAILLGHQYTPANFSIGQLKLHDRPRAEALMTAAQQAGYFATLGLVTLYRLGELEGKDYYYDYGRRNRRYYDEEEEDEESGEGTMGEVFEEYTEIRHWGSADTPGLGELLIREADILTDFEMGEESPIEQEEEGYTGNAGMTIEYWYHYGAVVLWPQSRQEELLRKAPVQVRLDWLEYYLRHWDETGLNPQEFSRQLLMSVEADAEQQSNGYAPSDFSPVAAAFGQLGDEGFLKQHGEALLAVVFDTITVAAWLSLLQHFKPDVFHPIFQKAADKGDVFVIRHLLDIVKGVEETGSKALNPFALHYIQQMPDYLGKTDLDKLKGYSYHYEGDRTSRKEAVAAIVENVLALSIHMEKDPAWTREMLELFSRFLSRKFANKVLAPILLAQKYSNRTLAKGLCRLCLEDLKARTANKPSPPADWSREVPESVYYPEIWEFLASFLRSSTQQVFDYRANQSYRSEMERAIESVKVDLAMETIRKGSPHILRLTKTQAAYERNLKKWEEDVALLAQMEEAGC